MDSNTDDEATPSPATESRDPMPPARGQAGSKFLYGLAISVSAFLLFLVQPLIARQILPWFGGSAAVWSTCMVFFQVTLLAGYFYADWMVRRASPRKQAWVHTILLVVSMLTLPLAPHAALRPADASLPTLRILLVLAAAVGLPYLLLSTTGPLVQAWFTRRFSTGEVYRLYALSNLFSMLSLVSYPTLLEPQCTTTTQSHLWSAMYVVFAAVVAWLAWQQARAVSAPGQTHGVDAAQLTVTAQPEPAPPEAPLSKGQIVQWLTLSALASVLLLALTTHLTQNVASIPFLWVVPLALYLLSFVLTFDGKGWYWRRFYPAAAAVMAVTLLGALSYRPALQGAGLERGFLHIHSAVVLFSVGLLILCMFLNGELVARKPAPAQLTQYFLIISLGGALGGTAVALIAPLVFDYYWELQLSLVAAAALVALLSPHRWQRFLGAAAALVAICLAVDFATYIHRDVVDISRNFYGSLRVKAAGPDRDPQALMRLVHGVILHGEQARERAREPSTYYGPTSGIGETLLGLRALTTPGDATATTQPAMTQHVGLIGLGVGTLTAYARAGDRYRLYELNPAVVDIAQRYFTYLRDAAGQMQVVLGDARLSLEGEPPQQFDVLAVDAFSSDSIPVHLLTAEAMATYRRHLKPDGVIVFHISNRYLDLTPVVQGLADNVGLQARQVIDSPAKGTHLSRSDWVAVTGNRHLLDRWAQMGVGRTIESPRGTKLWHDNDYNLLTILK